MMYHLDGRRRRQSLVYFGEPQDLTRGKRRQRRDAGARGSVGAPPPLWVERSRAARTSDGAVTAAMALAAR